MTQRHSVRRYKEIPIEPEKIKQIQDAIDEINAEVEALYEEKAYEDEKTKQQNGEDIEKSPHTIVPKSFHFEPPRSNFYICDTSSDI